MGNPRWVETTVPRYLPNRVAQIYYAHGLFCSSHPILVTLFTFCILLLCCYPLLNLPLPGNVPQCFSDSSEPDSSTLPSKWSNFPPKLYIQQIIMKSSVSPWNDNLILTDAFRGPLAESFKLVEIIHNYQHRNSSLSLDNLCVHVETVKQKLNKMVVGVLPEYNCLMLSPSNLWNQDFNRFQMDTNLINTVYNYQNVAKGKTSISEMLFGLTLKDSGIKRYPVRSKQRVIKFAITIFMTSYQPMYIRGLHDYLKSLYPIHQFIENSDTNINSTNHICYPEEVDYSELIPLSITFLMIFSYMYYLVRKMENIRSKFKMALSAVLTILASLLMTVGICFFFGLEFTGSGNSKQVFPYLVIIVGLENIFVLTKSVVTTLPHLDSKIRVAQGLSKEGWNITKNLLIEVTILTVGLLTFVPAIQEFCIFAIVGVLSDFFLQMVLFSTLLSVYIRCVEHCTYPQYSYYTLSSPFSWPKNTAPPYQYSEQNKRTVLSRSRSQPKLTGENIIATGRNSNYYDSGHIPKRVKVVHFWAKTRIVQRCFMIGMVGWIAVIAYNGGTIHNFIASRDEVKNNERTTEGYKRQRMTRSSVLDLETKLLHAAEEIKKNNFSLENDKFQTNVSEEYGWLKRKEYESRRRLSSYHWSSIMSLYNTSLSGSCITILPPLHIAQHITPEKAQALRNPNEKGISFRWQSLAIALDPLDFTDLESTVKSTISRNGDSNQPLVPTSPIEIMMTALLCITSVLVLMYTVFVLYRCICTRNYAEWRASWTISSSEDTGIYATQVVLEAVPISIQGHQQQIECISSDGNVIVSTCLAGQVKIWDSITGDFITEIDRSKSGLYLSQYENAKNHINENLHNYPPALDNIGTLYDLTANGGITTHFTENTYRSPSTNDCKNTIYCRKPLVNAVSTVNKNFNQNSSEVDKNFNHIAKLAKTKCNDMVTCGNSQLIENRIEVNCIDERVNCSSNTVMPIWCLDCKDNLVVLGCADGTLEFWECTTGVLKCVYKEEDLISITTVKLIDRTVIAGKLNGGLCFYRLDIFLSQKNLLSHNPYTKQRRGHTRTGSMGSIGSYSNNNEIQEIHCIRVETKKPHSLPITVLEVEGGRAITGSQDHTLKIFSVDDQRLLYTLIGHHGPITCIFIDRINPKISASGSQDGLLCVWDLHTGSCMYNIQAHDGAVCALTYSVSYIISLGIDERLCIWDRFRGHLLNTVSSAQAYCTSLSMLTHNLLVTSKQGCLMVIDVGIGEPVRIVKLGHSDKCIFVKQIINLGDGIVCDYGDQLRLVRFPLAYDKSE